MSEQYKPNIGETPDELARRDAIHIAVVPLIAGEMLFSGDSFSLTKEGTAVLNQGGFGHAIAHHKVGIVDPFLHRYVQQGTWFWGFLYPNTITNLRHVWEHEAFKPKPNFKGE